MCHSRDHDRVLAPVTLIRPPMCWCEGKVGVAPPGTHHHPQGEVMSVPRQCWLRGAAGDLQLQDLARTSLALDKQQ